MFNDYSPTMKKKVLVIENDDSILEIVSYVLQQEGYEVKAIHTQKWLFEHVEDYEPDAIVLDVIRPTDEGSEICRTLKANPKTKHIPVIVFSTHSKVMETIKQVCADEVVPKPFDISELISAVGMQLAS